jgi:sRNA-binding protein
MKKRQQFDTARQIAGLRALQLERARMDTVRVMQAFEHSRAHEQALSDSLNAHLEGWRSALRTPGGFSLSLAGNWAGAVASVRTAHLEALQNMRDATAQLEQQRTEMTRREQQAEYASEVANRARRQFERYCDEQQTNRIEDMPLSQEGH